MLRHCFISVVAFLLLGHSSILRAESLGPEAVDTLLSECMRNVVSKQEKTESTLAKLRVLQPTFTEAQNEEFHSCAANSLGMKGKHEERIALVQSFLGQVKAPARRARFLYQLIDGYTALGKYENALLAMNEAILLLPHLKDKREKASLLQGAITLLETFHAYDEGLDFAERIYELRDSNTISLEACIGLANKVEMNFLRGNGQLARSLVPEAILACSAKQHEFFSLIVRTESAIDLVDSGKYIDGINVGLPLLRQWAIVNSDYYSATQLEEALARAYLKTGNVDRAEHFGLQAFQRAQADNILVLQEKTSETMAAIKRAGGELADAIYYYDINLALKKRLQDEQLQKNLAYQRVKFDTQDKVNQMALLDQKNKNLNIEKELQNRKYQNLVLLLTLGLILLTILGAWLARTLRQKDVFRVSAQLDGLTQISNRAHFTTVGQQLFSDATRQISLVLFDMDSFKSINDTYGHAAGDWVLKTVCAVVKAQLRKSDIVGRLGGEEFAICLPASSAGEVHVLTERCRSAIAAIDSSPCGFSFPVTASFGIATRNGGQALNFEETLVAADKALYLSKNGGRNCITVFQASTGAQ